MTDFINHHNQWIVVTEEKITSNKPLPEETLAYHQSKVSYLQHERHIHLLILIFVGIVLISVFISSLFLDYILLYLLILILGILFIFYIKHYYLLENTVQSWYKTTEKIMVYQKITSR